MDGAVPLFAARERVTDAVELLVDDVLPGLVSVPDGVAQCIVTSPPYLDARDYGIAPTAWPEVVYRPRFDLDAIEVPASCDVLGAETSLRAYVGHVVLVARALRRVLRPDGTLWLNLAAGYSCGTTAPRRPTTTRGPDVPTSWSSRCSGPRITAGLPAKQRIPAASAVCDALQAEGWWVRNRIIWSKPNAKPDSTRDRCTVAHEELFLLTPRARYYFDRAAISTPAKHPRSRNASRRYGADRADPGDHHGDAIPWQGETAAPRDVWTIPATPYRGAHFATFPRELARRCIAAGSRVGDLVIDPFAGTGTVGEMAQEMGRRALLIEASASSAALLRARVRGGAAYQPTLAAKGGVA